MGLSGDGGIWMRLKAYALLSLASAAWAGNVVLSRAVRAEIPPIGLAFWRWLLATLLAAPFLLPVVLRNRAVVRREWKLIASLAFLGMTVFHTLLYFAVHTTTAINATLILSISPLLAPALSRVVLGRPQTRRELIGAALSAVGVVVIVARGDAAVLGSLAFTRGDLMMLGATMAWTLYSVLLERKPADLEPGALLGSSMAAAALFLSPLYAWEALSGLAVPWTAPALLVFAYLALFPSLLASYCYNRGVAEVGPVLASFSLNLIPVFATVFAMLFLDERLHAFHVVGVLAIGAGAWLATSALGQGQPLRMS
jgi:drug/metabolite transporter (DMT)-like permease